MKRSIDLTQGSPMRLILFYTLPIMLGNIVQTLYNTADTAIVGRFAGLEKLAAVGSTGSLSFFIFGFLYGLTGGFSIMVAQRKGARDEEGLKKSVAHAIVLTAILVGAVTAIAVPLTKPILSMINTPENILDDATIYLSIIFAGTVFSAVYNLVASILRSIGDSKTPLYFLIISCVLNVILDIVFIVPLKMDVAGAALATIIAQGFSGLLCVFYAVKRFPELHLKREHFKLERYYFSEMFRLGLPMALQSSITAAGMIILQAALNGFGANTIAGYTAAGKVESMVAMPGFALSTTMANFAGQNTGAGRSDRVRKGVNCGLLLILIWSTISSLFCVFAGMPIMRFFVTGEAGNVAESLAAGQVYLNILAWFFLPFNALFVYRSTLQGIGRSIYTLVGGTIEMIMRVAVSFLLPGLIGFAGVCFAGPAAWVGADIVLVIAYYYEMRKAKKQLI